MIYRQLAGTGYRVSAEAMGSALFGAAYGQDFCFGQLDIFAQAGGNLVDTAHVYNDWIPGEKARSEKVIGRWLKSRGMAGQVVVMTKGAHPPLDRMEESRVRPGEIRRDLAQSRDNLGLEAIDLYLLHRDDPQVPVGEIVAWMDQLVREGLIRHWGVSNWTLERIQAAQGYAAAHGLAGIRMNQTMWSFASIRKEGLEDQTLVPLDRAAYDYHCATGLNLTAFTSQAKGYFPRLAGGEALPQSVTQVYDTPINQRKMAFLVKTRAQTGLSIAALCLLFFQRQPFCAIPVVSYDTDRQLTQALEAYGPQAQARAEQVEFPLWF